MIKKLVWLISILLISIFFVAGCGQGKGKTKISDFNLTLDVNESEVSVNLLNQFSIHRQIDVDTINVNVLKQGDYGTFVVEGEILTYLKTTETNATDVGVLEISVGTKSVDVNVTIISLYWKQVASGDLHTVAIKSDGTLWGWGANSNGQLGDGTTTDRLVPTQEATYSTNWSQISAKAYRTLAIKADGTLWGWGENGYGELGDSTYTDKLVPTQETSFATNWKQVSSGRWCTIAIKTDGTLWGWGWNGHGVLGDGTTTNSLVPTQEASLSTNWLQVDAGDYHTAAVKSDGTLWAWGNNNYGQVGDGTITLRVVPTQEASLSTNWLQVESGGYYYTTGIKSDGTLLSWGSNSSGQLGDGTTIDRWIPTQEASFATDWKQISTGHANTAAVKSDGTLWGWGENIDAKIGDGTTTNRLVPTQEASLSTEWSHVDTGGKYHTVALKSDGTLWAWGYVDGTWIYTPIQYIGRE